MGTSTSEPASAGTSSGKANVFVSYSRLDTEVFALELAAALEAFGGFAVSIDQHSIVEGEEWKRRLGALIAEADSMVFIISPGSVGSGICHWEVEEAVRQAKRILPVLWQPAGAQAVPEQLAAINYTRFDGGRSFVLGVKALIAALKTDLDWLREHTRLLSRATDWVNDGRAANRLLTGTDIARAKDWVARRPRTAPEPAALHLDYIQASEAWQEAQNSRAQQMLEERERLIRNAEAALAEKEAAQSREAEAARRAVRRTMVGLISASVLVVIAGGFGTAALLLNAEAQRQRSRAEQAAKDAETAKQEILAQRKMAADLQAAMAEVQNTFADNPAVKPPPAGPVSNPDPAAGRTQPAVAFATLAGKHALPLPLDGKIVLSFGDKTQSGGQSKGMVYEAAPKSVVKAPADGWVVYAGEFRSYGKLVILNPGGGYHVLIAGLNDVDVSAGQFVLTSETIGKLSGGSPASGKTTAANPVLYLEFRKDGVPIDPRPWLMSSAQGGGGGG